MKDKKSAFTRQLVDITLAGLGAALVVITLVAVFCRYFINHSLAWSDEVVRYLFVWFTLLGGAVALRECEHIRVEYFVEKLPTQLRWIVEITLFVVLCLFQVALVGLGIMWVHATRGSLTSALQWPLNLFFYAALPVSALLSLWYAIQRIVQGKYTEYAAAAVPDVAEQCTGDEPCSS